MLMRREPLSGGLFVEEFVELNPRARHDSVTATAPLYAERALKMVTLVGSPTPGLLHPDDGPRPVHGRAKTSAGRSDIPNFTFHAVA